MAINFHNRCYLTDLTVADVKPSIRISLFSNAPLKQMVLGVVGSNGQKFLNVFVARANESTPTFIRTFCSNMWSHGQEGAWTERPPTERPLNISTQTEHPLNV
jgi:hypothetical protein